MYAHWQYREDGFGQRGELGECAVSSWARFAHACRSDLCVERLVKNRESGRPAQWADILITFRTAEEQVGFPVGAGKIQGRVPHADTVSNSTTCGAFEPS